MERIFKAGSKSLLLNKKLVMGILNVTPDSFSDGGDFLSAEKAVAHAKKMISYGAQIIDVGGQSTRPGYQEVSPDEEWSRIERVLIALLKETDAVISVDTYFPQVAKKALELGVHIINDVTGFDTPMLKVTSESDCGIIIMHSGGGNGNIVETVRTFFENKVKQANEFGIKNSRICLDPGIGFGKSYEENLSLIANVDRTRLEDIAYLMAASRKRVIAAACASEDIHDRDMGTLAAHAVSMIFGADIIRAHDVKNAVLSARVCDEIISERN